MSTKHEWRKKEKQWYIPKNKPEAVDVPSFNFITISGQGSPDEDLFTHCVGALYALSYTIKMTLKKMDSTPEGYLDYTVYPLEGIWDINDEAKKVFNGTVNKEDFVYDLMIRQPDFITESFFKQMLAVAKSKKGDPFLDQVKFITLKEGPCIQMLHVGPFKNEPESFAIMESFCESKDLKRQSKLHREIYLSDPRKVSQDKLKTVLRFKTA